MNVLASFTFSSCRCLVSASAFIRQWESAFQWQPSLPLTLPSDQRSQPVSCAALCKRTNTTLCMYLIPLPSSQWAACFNVIYSALMPLRWGRSSPGVEKSLPEEQHTQDWVCISMFYEVTQDHGQSGQTGYLSDTAVQTTETDEKTRYILQKGWHSQNGALLFYFYSCKTIY